MRVITKGHAALITAVLWLAAPTCVAGYRLVQLAAHAPVCFKNTCTACL